MECCYKLDVENRIRHKKSLLETEVKYGCEDCFGFGRKCFVPISFVVKLYDYMNRQPKLIKLPQRRNGIY